MLLVLTLLACHDGTAATAEHAARTVKAELLEVRADIAAQGDTTRWNVRYWARARVPTRLRTLPPGRCERAEPAAVTAPKSAPRPPDQVRVLGGLALTLEPQREPGRATWWANDVVAKADPAWAVLDLRRDWRTGIDVSDTRTSAIRMGPAPDVTGVERLADGSVRLAWSAGSVDEVRIVTTPSGGSMHCGGDATGVTLPWWSVPARGGEVVIESTRVHASGPDDAMRVASATIARHVRLDAEVPATRSSGAAHPGDGDTPRTAEPPRAGRSKARSRLPRSPRG